MIGGYKMLMWIGIVIILVPFLGVPSSWTDIILFLSGMILVLESILFRHQVRIIKNKNSRVEK